MFGSCKVPACLLGADRWAELLSKGLLAEPWMCKATLVDKVAILSLSSRSGSMPATCSAALELPAQASSSGVKPVWTCWAQPCRQYTHLRSRGQAWGRAQAGQAPAGDPWGDPHA